jgi:hypothetical protein
VAGPLAEAESNLASGDLSGTADLAARLESVMGSILPADPDSVRKYTARLEALRDGIAIANLERDIGGFVGEAGRAQEEGDYTLAIALLRSLEVRADEAPPSRRTAMRDLLSLFRVSNTIAELIKACEFEREFLGRTEPCEGQ